MDIKENTVPTNNAFLELVQAKMKNFTRSQRIVFQWLCAVRALPFLGEKKLFSFWDKEDIDRYLLSVFTALDVARAYDVTFDRPISAAAAHRAANAVSHSYIRAAAAARSAACASKASGYANEFEAAQAAVIAAGITGRKSASLINIILNDLEAIKADNSDNLDNNTAIYENIWTDFIDSLCEIGCGYWARWYEALFSNKFVVNKIELRRRLCVPDELRSLGASAVGRYLEKLGQSDFERLNEARIIILGEKGAGKTSLARKLIDINDGLPNLDESTEGVDVSSWRIPNDKGEVDMNVHIWDFAGHTITHAAHRCFMSSRALYIYVYNGRVEHDNRPEYWLEQIKIYGGNSRVLFLVNSTDSYAPLIERKTLQAEYPNILDYYSVNIGSSDTHKLEEFRQIVINAVRNDPAWNLQEMRADAYCIKEDLRTLFKERQQDFITQEDFNKIAKRNYVSSQYHAEILEHLKILGVCLWYNTSEMRDFNHVVLNPSWITHGIYRIINWGHQNNRHIMSINDGKYVFTSDEDELRYPADKIRFLFKLMREFELAFFENASEDNVFIPLLLSPDRPDALPTLNTNDSITMVYKVENALPPSIISRLIVRRYDEIDMPNTSNELWRKGAVLHYRKGDAIAQIIESRLKITIEIMGKDKTSFLVSLRDSLNGIFKSYEALDFVQMYELIIPPELEATVSLANFHRQWHSDKIMESSETLKEHLDKGVALLKFGTYIPLELTESTYALEDPDRASSSEIRKLTELLAKLLKQLESENKEHKVQGDEMEAINTLHAEAKKSRHSKFAVNGALEFIRNSVASAVVKQLVQEIWDIFIKLRV
jgi:GTPase SAR1 family protein